MRPRSMIQPTAAIMISELLLLAISMVVQSRYSRMIVYFSLEHVVGVKK